MSLCDISRSDSISDVKTDSLIKMLQKTFDAQNDTPMVTPKQLIRILVDMEQVFRSQPVFLRITPPLVVLGDIHGQYSDMLRIFHHAGHVPKTTYLFLGDYVDRGRNSIETILLLFLYKLRYPESIYLLRGNHECEEINKIYGFYDELNRRYPGGPGAKVWKYFQNVFAVMPVAALVGNKMFCMHGGLPRDMNLKAGDFSQLESIQRPYEIPPYGIVCDLLWADPGTEWGFQRNARGVSHTFGPDVLHLFCVKKDIDILVRAHQVVENGYELSFDNENQPRLVTIFSAPNYCGEFNNRAGIMKVAADLRCTFSVVKPSHKKLRRSSSSSRSVSLRG